MFFLKRFFIFTFFLVAALPASAQNLAKGKIGPLEAGVHVFELAHFDTNAKVAQVMQEGEYFLEYTFTLKNLGEVKALLSEDNATVYRLTTHSEKFSTTAGAYVGMTLKELRSIYPAGVLDVAWESIESSFVFILPESEGVFVFNGSSIKSQCWSNLPKCEEYLSDLKSEEFFTF